MTKADRIRALYAEGLSTSEIAEEVECLPEYVRVVARQRKNSGTSEIDRRYLRSTLGQATVRKRWESGGKAAHKAYYATVYASGDLAAANEAAQAARKEARANGAHPLDVNRAACAARSRVLLATGCKASARRAARKARLQMRTFHVNKEEVHSGQQA
jgi:hypothetical protein